MPGTASPPQTIQIDFEPVGRRIAVHAGATLLEAAQSAGIELVAICGGGGSCGTCRIRLMQGELSSLSLAEEAELDQKEIATGYRLACQAQALGDARIDIPPESLTTLQRLQVEGLSVEIEPDPLLTAVEVFITPPNLFDLRSDATRVKDTLAKHGYPSAIIGHSLLTDLPQRLRAQNWSARLALRGNEVVAILPSPDAPRKTSADLIGLAVDVGTTKLAAYLVDLTSGVTLAKAGAMNPQIAYGEDVVSRIAYANEHTNGLRILQERLIASLNQLATDLCAEAGVERRQIAEAVVVGNTAMHHLFAGLPVQQLGTSPYVPVVSEAIEVPAGEVGLELAPAAKVFLPPNIAGYVGADHVAMLLARDVGRAAHTAIALDIGTNTEITLASEGRLLSCSCASGPAFEGAHIQDGMRAAPGAIERVQMVNGEVRTHTIGGLAPVGICGSGILDAIAELLASGILDQRGALSLDDRRVRRRNGKAEFVLVPAQQTGHGQDIVVTRSDVNEIQLAKGAIRAGVEVLLREAGKNQDDIQEFVVAGAFGTYLDLVNAVRVGMFPALPPARFKQVGNAAGMGARQMLISAARRQEAARVAQRVEYVELTTHRAFSEEFYRAMYFGDFLTPDRNDHHEAP